MSQALLCVDDRSEMLRVRKDHLERLGFSVVTATDSASALEILEKMDVAAVLLDDVKQLQGFETNSRIRS